MARSRWSVACGAAVAAIVVASLVALVWVHQWAVGACCGADREAELLIDSTMMAAALLAAPVVLARVISGWPSNELTKSVAIGAAGAFVALVPAAASTLLIAMAISPATDPGEFGRPLFKVAYGGALILTVSVGLVAVWCADVRDRRRGGRVAAAVMLVLTVGAFASLATGSSELNQCFVDHEFPLPTNHVCAGY